MHVPIFRIFYSTTFTVLLLLLAALLLITPGDHIYQAFRKRHLYKIFIISGACLLTLLVTAFIYASRLYTNRSVLASIPRELNLLEKGKSSRLPRRVRRLVREGLERSAWISWLGRPRDISKAEVGTVAVGHEKTDTERSSTGLSAAEKQLRSAKAGAEPPMWGTISHPGWSSPESADFPNLHLPPVILELPHLIEAKAVSLAPSSISNNNAAGLGINPEDLEEIPPEVPSPVAISLLQRPTTMGLREYLTQLSSLDLINPPHLAGTFLTTYERARFSGREISEADFRALMGVFAEILRGMKSLPPNILEELKAAEAQDVDDAEVQWLEDGFDGAEDADVDYDGQRRASMDTTSTVAHTPLPVPIRSSTNPSSTGSRLRRSMSPSSPQSHGRNDASQQGSVRRGLRTPSIPSIRATRSLRSKASSVFTSRSSDRSVIHLAEERGPLDLPYLIETAGAGGA